MADGDPGAASRRRDHLANERTYLAWLRTGANVMVVGLAVARLLDPGSIGPLVAGALLVITGAAGIVLATLRSRRIAAEIDSGEPSHDGGRSMMLVVSSVLIVVVIVAVVLLFVFR